MIGFIGCGNMGSAIVKSICDKVIMGRVGYDSFLLYDKDIEKSKALKNEIFKYKGVPYPFNEKILKVDIALSESEIAEKSDIIVLCVKPDALADVIEKIKASVNIKKSLVISIAAGKTTSFIFEKLGFKARVARIMPNFNATVGAAVSGYCVESSKEDKAFVKAFCECFGTAVELLEKDFSVFTAVAGCAPAFCYMFIDSLARGAVKYGLPKDKALEIAVGTVLGSAKMVGESDEHPWTLVDRVCSPGGTTIEGVTSLQENGFESAVMKAVEASYLKDNKV